MFTAMLRYCKLSICRHWMEVSYDDNIMRKINYNIAIVVRTIITQSTTFHHTLFLISYNQHWSLK